MARHIIKNFIEPADWGGVGDVAKKAKKFGHQALCDEILSSIPESGWPSNEGTNLKNWTRNGQDKSNKLNIFTDGSRIEERSGCGWVATKGDAAIAEGVEYLGDTSVFNAELIAIQGSLIWVEEHKDGIVKKYDGVCIYSDSKAGIQSLFAPYIKDKIVYDVVKQFNCISTSIDVHIEWVKGHDDNTGNECADMLAKKGTEVKEKTINPRVPINKYITKRAFKNYYDEIWQSKWSNTEGCKASKLFVPQVARKNCKAVPKMSCKLIKDLTEIVTGHGFFAGHMRHWKEGILPELCGEEKETTPHLWSECR